MTINTLICEWCGQSWTPTVGVQRRTKKPRTCGAKCRTALRMKEHGQPPQREYPPEIVERVRDLYYNEGLGLRAIEDLIGPGYSARTIMRRFNMSARPVGAHKGGRTGESNPQWKGAAAGYNALHVRVERARGKPKECRRCGTTDPAVKYEWANLTGNYTDVNDYERMCRLCHHRYDMKRRSETGAPTMPRGVAS